MRKRARRHHTTLFKASVALAAIKEDKTLSELAQEFDVHDKLIAAWKAKVLKGVPDIFGRKSDFATKADLEELHAKIEKLALGINALSYTLSKPKPKSATIGRDPGIAPSAKP